jgi:hypothetical protein
VSLGAPDDRFSVSFAHKHDTKTKILSKCNHIRAHLADGRSRTDLHGACSVRARMHGRPRPPKEAPVLSQLDAIRPFNRHATEDLEVFRSKDQGLSSDKTRKAGAPLPRQDL